MCILFLSVLNSTKYPLLFCSNRDEATNRATVIARPGNFNGGILAGRDLKRGGTWLGMTTGSTKRVAIVLNVAPSESSLAGAPSRGQLPLQWLRSPDITDPREFMAQLLESEAGTQRQYSGFSLIIASIGPNGVPTVVWGTNSYGQERGKTMMHVCSEKGIYAFTNNGRMYRGPTQSTDGVQLYWSKSRRGWHIMQQCLKRAEVLTSPTNETTASTELIDHLLEDLLHCTAINDEFSNTTDTQGNEQEVCWSTHVSDKRKLLAPAEVPIFLEWSEYATRTSTIVMYNQDDSVLEYISKEYNGTNETRHQYNGKDIACSQKGGGGTKEEKLHWEPQKL